MSGRCVRDDIPSTVISETRQELAKRERAVGRLRHAELSTLLQMVRFASWIPLLVIGPKFPLPAHSPVSAKHPSLAPLPNSHIRSGEKRERNERAPAHKGSAAAPSPLARPLTMISV